MKRYKKMVAALMVGAAVVLTAVSATPAFALAAEAEPAAGSWSRYTPCNRLEIGRDVLEGSLVVGKMTHGRPMVVWSEEPLSDSEKEAVMASVKTVPGAGNPKNFVFTSGAESSAYGLSVDSENGLIVMDHSSDWSLLLAGKAESSETGNEPENEPEREPENEPESEPENDPENEPEVDPGILDGEGHEDDVPPEIPDAEDPGTDEEVPPETPEDPEDDPDTPADGGEETPETPADGGEETPDTPADGGEETPDTPADGGKETPDTPADGGEETPDTPADGGEETPETPADGGEETPDTPAAPEKNDPEKTDENLAGGDDENHPTDDDPGIREEENVVPGVAGGDPVREADNSGINSDSIPAGSTGATAAPGNVSGGGSDGSRADSWNSAVHEATGPAAVSAAVPAAAAPAAVHELDDSPKTGAPSGNGVSALISLLSLAAFLMLKGVENKKKFVRLPDGDDK